MNTMEEKKAGHTPGPWETDGEVEHMAVLGPDSFMVADCAIFSLRKRAPSEARCIANARLIAAAPDLAESVRALLSLHEAHHNNPVHAAARAALSKAGASS